MKRPFIRAGLALAGASAISHDLYATVLKKGKATEKQEMRVTRIATVGLGIIAILLGILAGEQIVPVGRHLLQGMDLRSACSKTQATEHVLGQLPGRKNADADADRHHG